MHRVVTFLVCLAVGSATFGTYVLADGEGGGGEDVTSTKRPVLKNTRKKTKTTKAKKAAKKNRTSTNTKRAPKTKKAASRREEAAAGAKKPRRQSTRATRVRRAAIASGMPPAGEARLLENQVIVRYYLDANQRQMDALVGRLGLRHLSGRTFQLAGITAHLYSITDGSPVRTVIAGLEADPNVASAQPNYLYALQQSSGQQTQTAQSGAAQYSLSKLSIDSVHAVTKGGAVPVAVIDTGIDRLHPELAATEIEALDAVKAGKSKAHNHGTSVAGIIVSNGALRGVAPDVKLIGVRAFAVDRESGATRGTSWQIALALDLSFKAGAQVLNLSFAGPSDPLVGKSIEGSQSRGLIAVAAAGNDGPKSTPAYPAAYPGVIAVTATDQNDAIYAKANHGDYIQIAAPGVGILAPVSNGGYEISSGTSLAAAHVSGLIALILSRKQSLSPKEIRAILEASSRDLGPPGWDSVFGAGLPDAKAAVLGAES